MATLSVKKIMAKKNVVGRACEKYGMGNIRPSGWVHVRECGTYADGTPLMVGDTVKTPYGVGYIKWLTFNPEYKTSSITIEYGATYEGELRKNLVFVRRADAIRMEKVLATGIASEASLKSRGY